MPDIEGGQVLTDPADIPSEFSEAPWFASLVAAGSLPPVAERIGQDPLVIKPLQSTGTYGGTIRRGFVGVDDRNNANRFCAGPDSLLYWDYTGTEVTPNIARSYELSDDNMTLTLSLRRGMRWSDGTPFTADDIMFWYEHMNLNANVSAGSPTLRNATIEKVDDFTVQFVGTRPIPLLPAYLAGYSDLGGQTGNGFIGGGTFAPAHYLQQFHADFTSEAEANQLAQDAGFGQWGLYIQYLNNWNLNKDLPTVTPWILSRAMNQPPWQFTANPYSIWVDDAGNQLPYIEKIDLQSASGPDVIGLRTAAGDFDFQDRHLSIDSMPVLLESQEQGDYTIHRTPSSAIDFAIKIDLSYNFDPVLGELIRTTDFRRALSLAINREDANETFFLGTGVPSCTMAADEDIYFPGPDWRLKWAEHDPEQANELLDSIGLTDKDDAGFRLRPDGGGRIRLEYAAANSFMDFLGLGEMVLRQWADIGIDVAVQELGNNLLGERNLSGELMMTGNAGGSDNLFLFAPFMLPVATEPYLGVIGLPYAKWFQTDGAEGTEPPPALDKLKDALGMFQQGLESDEDERVDLGKEIFKMHADEVWSIGVVGFSLGSYGLYSAKNNMRNVPARILSTNNQKSPSNAWPMTFYYEDA